ncbi:rhomboid family protein [Pseudozobellia thermophila]|uniref:Membrane associated serine protease, rhomboid family n=1 Tax=Pseudozobellia thermophila TaxID=192903 RepID=A0A1M6J2G1_9FLAO|nr:rhomboid family intramembrane serine protease [Pseudozobellia thermophila]SHJ40827.1 Membrane associated serine protease, rhomboid family [Pseudozobellia thermophila]
MSNGGLRYQYARLSVSEKLIVINVLVFIIMGLITALISPAFENWFALPKDFFDFLMQPWSLITYSFLHAGLLHILWNMYILYVAGRIVLNLFDGRRFLNIYFLGVILGGLLFLLSYNVFPALMGTNTSLIGASAGVMAVLIFVCTYIPNHEVRLIFFNVKLWQIGVFVVLMDLVQIPMSDNVGGHIAHLGGALLGYMYARQLYKGTDIGEGFAKIIDGLANLFSKRERKSPLKTVYKNKSAPSAHRSATYDKKSQQKKIDAILDKISQSGYESLSKAEKDFLFKAGKED